MTDFKVAFCGLPSSGKSTIINSLLHKRLLQSGIARTTTNSKSFEKPIKDDDNNKICVIDLPGICDAEEKDNKFNELTIKTIEEANLICWVTDIKSAFITTHEVNEFTKIINHIEKIKESNIRLYHVAIILSKCSENVNCETVTIVKDDEKDDGSCISIDSTDENYIDDEEIRNIEEDSTFKDVVKNVKDKFKDIVVMPFNAFGRCYHHPKSTKPLKDFIINHGGIPSNVNTEFKITQFVERYKENNENFICVLCEKEIDKYINDYHQSSKNYFDHMINIFSKLSLSSKISIIRKYSNFKLDDKINWKLFKLNSFFYENSEIFIYDKEGKQLHRRVTKVIIYYLVHIIYTNSNHISYNLVKTYTFEELKTYINMITIDETYNETLFDDIFECLQDRNCINEAPYTILIEILQSYTLCNNKVYNYFKNILYDAFRCNEENKILVILKICKIHFTKTFNIEENKKNNFLDEIDNILKQLKEYCNDNYICLLNKIHCYNIIKENILYDNSSRYTVLPVAKPMPTEIIEYFCKNIRLRERITIMPEYKVIISIGMSNIYESILTEYDDILNVKPLFLEEIM